MHIEPFRSEHLAEIRLQAAQIGRFATPQYAAGLARLGSAFTARAGEILLCGGCVGYGYRRGSLWAYLSPAAGKHFIALHRATRRFIEAMCLERIEATVEAGFEPGCRWLEMLGFQLETPRPMRAFSPDGRDHYLYGWVR